MSYARYSPGESDVYIVGTGREGEVHLECMGCDLAQPDKLGGRFFWTNTAKAMLAHAKLHLAAGQLVPDYAIERLQHEAIEEEIERDRQLHAIMEKVRKAGNVK